MRKKYTILYLSIAAGVSLWIFDSIMDSFFFYQGKFVDLFILNPPKHEIYIRLIIMGIFLLFGFISSKFFEKQLKVEDSLKKSEKILQLILDTIPVSVFWKDRNLNYQGCNERFAKDARLKSVGEVMGKNDFEMVWKENAESYRSDDKLIILHGEPKLNYEEMQFRTDGTISWLRTSKIPLRDSNGTIIGVLGTYEDVTERKIAEDALFESERSLSHAQAVAHLGNWELNLTENEIYASDEAFRIYGIPGLTHHLPLGQIENIVYPEDRQKMDNALKQLLEQNKKYDEEFRISRVSNGELRFIHSLAELEYDSKGTPLKVVGTIQDISDRKKTEEELAFERFLFTSLMNTISDKIYFKDLNSQYIRVNKEMVKKHGVNDPSVLVGKDDRYFFTSEHSQQALFDEEEIIRTGNPLIGKEEKETWSDGSITWVSTSKFPLIDQKGNTIGTFGISRDITDRKNTEKELLFERFLLTSLMDTLPDKIYYKDLSSRFIRVNQATAKAHGINDPLLMVGKNDWDFFTDEFSNRMFENEQNIIKTGIPSLGEETKELWIDGTISWVSTNKLPLKDENDKIIGTFGVSRDITERKKAEDSINLLNTELVEKNKELEQIVYVTSHDLRSPLVNIQGFSKELQKSFDKIQKLIKSVKLPDLMRDGLINLLEEDIPESLHYISSSTSKMDVLLSGLLHLSRLGRAPLVMKRIDMNTMISDIVKTFEFQIKETNISLKIENLPICKGDEMQLNQLFSNIIDNAIKYLDKNRTGVIKIWGRIKEKKSLYCIEDNGIGISDNHKKKIFEIFYRLNPKGSSGEGLGLTIANKIIERHNGKVWVESKLGKGSRFYIELTNAV